MHSNQIVESFQDYLKSKDRYAVILSGNWGIGKTELWNKSLKPQIKNMKIIEVSLFGMSSRDEIKTAIINAVIQIGASGNEGFKFLGKAAETLFAAATESKAANGLSSVIGSFAHDQAFKSLGKTSIIRFDDFERSKLAPADILSVINQLVETQGVKVVILADEERLKDAEYQLYREKVIRHRWKLDWEPQEILEILIKKAGPNVRELLVEHKAIFEDVISVLEFNNLRCMIGTLSLLEVYFDKAGSALKEQLPIRLQILIYGLVVGAFSTMKDTLTDSEIHYWATSDCNVEGEESIRKKYKSSDPTELNAILEKNSRREKIRKILHYLQSNYHLHNFPSAFSFITDGAWLPNLLSEEVKYLSENNITVQQAFIDKYTDMSPEDFEKSWGEVKELLEAGQVKTTDQFSRLAGIHYQLIEHSVINEDVDTFTANWDHFLNKVQDEGGFHKAPDGMETILYPYTSIPDQPLLSVREKISNQYAIDEVRHDLKAAQDFWQRFKKGEVNRASVLALPDRKLAISQECLPSIMELLDTTPNDQKRQLGIILDKVIESLEDHKLVVTSLNTLIKHLNGRISSQKGIDNYWLSAIKISLENSRNKAQKQLEIAEKSMLQEQNTASMSKEEKSIK